MNETPLALLRSQGLSVALGPDGKVKIAGLGELDRIISAQLVALAREKKRIILAELSEEARAQAVNLMPRKGREVARQAGPRGIPDHGKADTRDRPRERKLAPAEALAQLRDLLDLHPALYLVTYPGPGSAWSLQGAEDDPAGFAAAWWLFLRACPAIAKYLPELREKYGQARTPIQTRAGMRQ
jgi:hypothetical protein